MYEDYILTQDNDCHWYVIPYEKEEEWGDFLELDPDDEDSWDVPDWAEQVGGSPSLVKFSEYRIDQSMARLHNRSAQFFSLRSKD